MRRPYERSTDENAPDRAVGLMTNRAHASAAGADLVASRARLLTSPTTLTLASTPHRRRFLDRDVKRRAHDHGSARIDGALRSTELTIEGAIVRNEPHGLVDRCQFSTRNASLDVTAACYDVTSRS